VFEDKTILITGGTGSFGNAVLTRLRDTNVREVRIFSRDEKKQDDLRRATNDHRIKFYIGDVRDYRSLLPAMSGADYVFQAAALKQVPSCEFYPMEAIKTNVLGTDNVLHAAIECRVSRVIALSTDKAVYPINVMGMTKALLEKLVVSKARFEGRDSPTTMCCTRYGNVMASRGSVIPLFLKQIQQAEALPITDPTMTRFLMSLDDAVDLVFFAFEHGRQGDTFIQKADASTIGDLAQAMCELFGYRNEVKIIGTRHGEKHFEVLCNREEMSHAEDLGDYFRIPADTRDLNYGKYFSVGEEKVTDSTDYNSHNTNRLNVAQVKERLMTLDLIRNALAATAS